MDFSRIFPPASRHLGIKSHHGAMVTAIGWLSPPWGPGAAGGTAPLDGPRCGDLGTLSDGRRRKLVPFLRARRQQSFCTALAARTDAFF